MNTTIDFTITGTAPMLMHSDRFANPIAPETIQHKKLTSKRTKTEEDHKAINRSEWMGSLYFNSSLGVYMPSSNVRRSLIEGAKLFKLGKQIERSVVFMEHDGFKLEYDGPKDPAKMYDKKQFVDIRSVKVSMARVMRCRPRFEGWALKGSLILNERMLSLEDLQKSFEAAGDFAGLGDYRPMFGRYDVSFK